MRVVPAVRLVICLMIMPCYVCKLYNLLLCDDHFVCVMLFSHCRSTQQT